MLDFACQPKEMTVLFIDMPPGAAGDSSHAY
jgi:hypothetical protein